MSTASLFECERKETHHQTNYLFCVHLKSMYTIDEGEMYRKFIYTQTHTH